MCSFRDTETEGLGSSIGSFQRPIVNNTPLVIHRWKIEVGLRVCFRPLPEAAQLPLSALCPTIGHSFLTSPFRISNWYNFVTTFCSFFLPTLWLLLSN